MDTFRTQILVWSQQATVTVTKITPETVLEHISRVYVIASNNDGKVGLIYNSKRNIRWFPGGHTEEGESITDSAKREYIEEMEFELDSCHPRYLLQNTLDDERVESQVICFWRVGQANNSLREPEESVTQTGFFAVEEVIGKIGNGALRERIMEDFVEEENEIEK